MLPVEIVVDSISPVEEFLLRAGAIATAIAAIITALVVAVRYLILRPLDAKLANRDRLISERVSADLGHRIQRLDDQLHSNGGSSLRDQTNRIEAALREHIADERDRSRVLSIELRTTNQRLERLAENHQHRKD